MATSSMGPGGPSLTSTRKRQPFFQKHTLKVGDRTTDAAALTLNETLIPLLLVTILYFLWGFAYGLLDTLNKHFQNTLHITRTRSSGLQAAYFGAYPLASLGYANWVMRKLGFRATFILGLVLYGIGSLAMWPAALNRSFGGFCGATFIIGSGLGSLETAANPYMAGKKLFLFFVFHGDWRIFGYHSSNRAPRVR